MTKFTHLPADSNQAIGLGQYAIDFLIGQQGEPSPSVLARTELFHVDSVACGVAALALGMNAPRVLRDEALAYRVDAQPKRAGSVFGSSEKVAAEKAVLANCAAVRELDSNGTNFGYNPDRGNCAGEFGHNDFYPVVVAAAQQRKLDGRTLLRGMVCLDEIRGRLAEVFALRRYKIDHVLHGGIASAAVYGALVGATALQIESAIGLLVAHHVPYRAIRAGHVLSDSKGSSAAITAEMAVTAVHRAMAGFVGPGDIFRNPQAVFCLNEPPGSPDASPFDLHLAMQGEDFAVMGMHFKMGLYEHQSAGAIEGLLNVLTANPDILNQPHELSKIRITIYQPAFGIIGDPAKRDPTNRQSADHSMVYIVATLLRKAYEKRQADWSTLMLLPADYDEAALFDAQTRAIMQKIEFTHGGEEFDRQYPDGIPTQVDLYHRVLGEHSSGIVMYPLGHARNSDPQFETVMGQKINRLAALGVQDVDHWHARITGLETQTAAQVAELYAFPLAMTTDGAMR